MTKRGDVLTSPLYFVFAQKVAHACIAEKAIVAVVQEAYMQGVSTRSVDELVKPSGMPGISKSQVSIAVILRAIAMPR